MDDTGREAAVDAIGMRVMLDGLAIRIRIEPAFLHVVRLRSEVDGEAADEEQEAEHE